MRILLTGGTGFLGSALVAALRARGDSCTVVSRRPGTAVRGDTSRPGAWQAAVTGHDAVINLAGELLVKPPLRWTAQRRARLWSSRVDTTINLADAIRHAAGPLRTLLSASAVGYYGDGGEADLDEQAPAGADWMARLCVAWERAARAVSDATRVVTLRSAPVLGPGGGLVQPMLLPFTLGLGGPWGSGRQWLPWIAREDWVRAILLLLDGDLDGPVNLAAPEPVRVRVFARALGAALHRPAWLRAPAWALRLALGKQADALLVSQRVMPDRLEAAGFGWERAGLPEALDFARP